MMTLLTKNLTISLALGWAITLSACARPASNDSGSTPTPAVQSKDCGLVSSISKSCIEIEWIKSPTETESGSLIFTVGKLNSIATTSKDAIPKVVAWMPDMGHGSEDIVVERLSENRFRATNVVFSMRGKWEIYFILGPGNESTNSLADQAIYAISF